MSVSSGSTRKLPPVQLENRKGRIAGQLLAIVLQCVSYSHQEKGLLWVVDYTLEKNRLYEMASGVFV